MAAINKPSKPMKTTSVVQSSVDLPASGTVQIILRGVEYTVSVEHAKTLIDKGSAKLKV